MENRGGWGDGASGAAENATDDSQADRDRVRIEFYATYDVMTGVRIAATLGGFFALMVFLIVYKSRSKSVKALNDPKLVELAEAVVAEEQAVEEERQLTAAIEEALSERARSRPSIGEEPPWPHSVFAEDDDSTDDEVEQFSTDSGGGEQAAGGEGTELACRPARPPLRLD
ncbi:hypothetical protein MSG28_001769, partial [Choristoneura fumiferana]